MHRFSEGMYFLFPQYCLHSSQTPHRYQEQEKRIKCDGIQFQSINHLLLPVIIALYLPSDRGGETQLKDDNVLKASTSSTCLQAVKIICSVCSSYL